MDSQFLSELPSLISSFSVYGNDEQSKGVPANCKFVEAYAFMQQSLPELRDSEESVVEYLSRLYLENNLEPVETALLAQHAGKKIVALATFMPELGSCSDDSSGGEKAMNALRLLVQVARNLKQKHSQPLTTIEVVAGTTIRGVFRPDPSREEYFIKRHFKSNALNKLIARLKEIAVECAKKPDIFLAVELEPGPLMLLSEAEMISRFCQLIEDSNDFLLKRHVGANLDIGHWEFLSKVNPDWLLLPENKHVFNRIVHAHVSDHHIGHFADLIVPTIKGHEERIFKWFSLLHRIAETPRTDELPKFSGFVSCEMEACREAEFVAKCYNNVFEMLSQAASNFNEHSLQPSP